MPGLDVVRGIAISMVLLYHGLRPHMWMLQVYRGAWVGWLRDGLEMGQMGVQIFFVLSGFLITGILIDSRAAPDYYKNFYLRRALRIVPAYLLMLAVLRLTHTISWMFVLVAMLYFCNMGAMFGVGHEYGPLWSLSVEEQFYLTWPLIVRKVSRKQLSWICVALLALTPVLRFCLEYGPSSLQDIRYKTWAVLDFFAAGGALAIAMRSTTLRGKLHKAVAPLLALGILMLATSILMPFPQNPHLIKMFLALELEPWLFLASGMVLLAALSPGLAKGFAMRPLIFLANISYGLYLCHQFLFYRVDVWWHLNPQSSIGLLPQLLLRFAVEAALAIAVATISRYTIEEFFLRMKPKHKARTQGYSVATKIT
jgi:peptidoglycan/LPS O-acetylase OafA/YrhL